MGFLSLFDNRHREDSLDRKITAISENISDSFQKVKEDIRSIGKWLNRFEESDKRHSEDISYLRSELQYLRMLLTERHSTKEKQIAVEPRSEPKATIIEDVVEEADTSNTDFLTDTQKAIFSRLGVIQKEGSQPWVPLKQIAHEIYPDKQYDEVRSTVSEYMGLLADAGLVKRVRKGKQTFVSISEKGSKFFVDNRKKLTPKVKE